jgi:radical SAM family uncharacterized protein
MVWNRLERLLVDVKSPSQYIGGEWNSVRKDHSRCAVRVAVAFPDTYAIGMSHLGLQILYGMINERPDMVCERAFSPWTDLEERMRRAGVPAFSVDSHTPLRDFDILGISLQSEMGYSNVVNLLDLAGIPLLSKDRSDRDPLVVAGGPNGSYAEPVADFFDAMILGDGEESFMALVEAFRDLRGKGRQELLRELVRRVPGCYVPSFYEIDYDGPRIRSIRPSEIAPATVKKADVPLEAAYYPLKPVVPFAEIVFDRVNLEIMRGCPHACRFCHAVNFKNRLRYRKADQLVDWAEILYRNTGLDEISLISLSSGDHPQIRELMTRLNERFLDRRVTIALPSLRVDERLKELPPLMKSGRKSGFTIAPEAGTETLRRIIRKPITDEDLFETARVAFREGFTHLKLYFMVGLPVETREDLDGIVETARACARIGREIRRKSTEINVTISPFVPKPHTAFQFARFHSFDYYDEIYRRLGQAVRGSTVRLKSHNPRNSYVEAAFARGDRRLSRVLLEGHRLGCKFDEWDEHYRLERWMRAFAAAGIDPDDYARWEPRPADLLPWDMLDVGTSKSYLWQEYETTVGLARRREQGDTIAGSFLHRVFPAQ